MTVISSQEFLSQEIVDAKIIDLTNQKSLVLQAYACGEDYQDFAVLVDGHHRLAAAKDLGIAVEFEIIGHPEGLTGERLLESMWVDNDYRNVMTGEFAF